MFVHFAFNQKLKLLGPRKAAQNKAPKWLLKSYPALGIKQQQVDCGRQLSGEINYAS
jgi:hypothetical protein